MRLSNKYGGLQFFADAPADITMVFDSHITKVIGILGSRTVEWTASNTKKMSSAVDGTTYTFDVTLESGYIIDSVTLSDSDSYGSLVDKTDTSFSIVAGVGGIFQTVTITSKLGGGEYNE